MVYSENFFLNIIALIKKYRFCVIIAYTIIRAITLENVKGSIKTKLIDYRESMALIICIENASNQTNSY